MKQQSKIVLVWNTKKTPKSISLSQRRLTVYAILGVGLFCVAVIVGIQLFSNSIYNAKVIRLQKNNSKLTGTLYDLENRIQRMESEVHVLTEKDQALRTYADIPVIDRDVRKLGIGGKYIFQGEELDNLLPDNDIKISKLANDLDRLTR
jgi:hypothetical protein